MITTYVYQPDRGIEKREGIEAFDELVRWLPVIAAVETAGDPELAAQAASLARRLTVAGERSDFRVAVLLAAVRASAEAGEND